MQYLVAKGVSLWLRCRSILWLVLIKSLLSFIFPERLTVVVLKTFEPAMVILIFLMSIADSGKADFSDSCMFMNKRWENSLL